MQGLEKVKTTSDSTELIVIVQTKFKVATSAAQLMRTH